MQWWLQEFGEVCHAYWGEVAYHVGSSLAQKDGWRDVDVRVMLDDEVYLREFGDPARQHQNPKWVAATLAWSALGRQMTGLPVDFQVQQRTAANTEFPHHRSALLRHHSHEIFGSRVPEGAKS